MRPQFTAVGMIASAKPVCPTLFGNAVHSTSSCFRLSAWGRNLQRACRRLEPAGELFRDPISLPFQGTFPDDRHAPSITTEPLPDEGIPGKCSCEFALPEFDIRRGHRCKSAPLVPVPKASVNKHGSTVFRKHEVRSPRQGSDMGPVSEPERMDQLSELQLRRRVPASYPRHHSRSCLPVHNVCQVFSSCLCSSITDSDLSICTWIRTSRAGREARS